MPAITELLIKPSAPQFPADELLISEDGEPMDSDWHGIELNLLRELVHQHLVGRQDFFAGGNMFIYFNEQQARNRDFRGPDFFFVWGVSPMPLRPYWAVWKEGGRYPNMIVELLSPTTADEDLTTKKDVYEQIFRTPEYYCYDPETRKIQAWRLEQLVYQTVRPNDKGWVWCEQLKLWLGTWEGRYLQRHTTWLRFYTQEGVLVPTAEEWGEQHVAAAKAESTTAVQKADEQRSRAEAAEAELALLKQQLQQKKD